MPRKLFRNFLNNIVACYKGRNWMWHLLAAVATYVCVVAGLDWKYYLITRNDSLISFFYPAILMGVFVPTVGSLSLLLIGVLKKSTRTVNTAWALGQASIVALLISDVYKAFTGRAHPNALTKLTSDITHVFHFGILKAGVFWGWPSSHTIVAFAMATALIALFPKNKKIAFVALVYAFYIGIGVSMTIHWLSDFLAGGILGSVAGIVVGRSFRDYPK